MSDELMNEASLIHSWVPESKELLDSDSYGILVVHSAALVGKAKKTKTLAADDGEEFHTRE